MIHLSLFDNTQIIPKFKLLLDKISTSSEPLALNFSQKEFNLDHFLSIDVMLNNDNIVAFSGLQYGRWGNHIGRISSRLWVDPTFRKSSVPTDFNSKFFMPHQINVAKEKGLKGVFWSTGRASNIKTFQKMIDRNNINCPFGWAHIALDGEYNVCGPKTGNPACIQKVAIVNITKDFYFDDLIKFKV